MIYNYIHCGKCRTVMVMCKPQASKAERSEVCHQEWHFTLMQPFPLTWIIWTVPLHQSYLPLSDREVSERPLTYPSKSNANGIVASQWLYSNCCKIVASSVDMDIRYSYPSQWLVKSDSRDTLNRDTVCRLEIHIISSGPHEYTIVHFEKLTVGTQRHRW